MVTNMRTTVLMSSSISRHLVTPVLTTTKRFKYVKVLKYLFQRVGFVAEFLQCVSRGF